MGDIFSSPNDMTQIKVKGRLEMPMKEKSFVLKC
jgi:hypothetical protein